MLPTTLFVFGIILTYMSIWYGISLILKRADVADFAWGLGFVVVAIATRALHPLTLDRGLIATLFVCVWGIRLASHIFQRLRSRPEDKRYQVWRQQWGSGFPLRSYFQVFLLQGALLSLIVAPVVIMNTTHGGPLGLLDVIGIAIWCLGFFFESVGDHQLAVFLRNPQHKGQLMRSGLWKYSRHPNYFGEVTQWWGIFVLALSVPYGLYGLIGPLTITFLILKVSGVPLLEKNMSDKPGFEAYKRTTSIFIPMPPRT